MQYAVLCSVALQKSRCILNAGVRDFFFFHKALKSVANALPLVRLGHYLVVQLQVGFVFLCVYDFGKC